MSRRASVSLTCLTAALLFTAGAARAVETEPVDPLASLQEEVTQGALRVVKKGGEVVECPLKHTDVSADIAGFIARVTVTQVFYNPLDEKIEAVYVFPLPHQAAVDDMTMVLGEKRIVGIIKRRLEAREIYEAALRQGATAALLEQERPNIFTQSVGNIEPGQEVRIEISYVDVLEYDMGVYTFHFPMVVGPRYIPGNSVSPVPPVPEELKGKVGTLEEARKGGEAEPASPADFRDSKAPSKAKPGAGRDPTGTGWAPDTDRVPDASRITPPVLKPGYRTGHDIRLSLRLDAGVPIQDLASPNHKVTMNREGASRAGVEIAPADSIPNKDFVLKYAVVGAKPEMAMLAHTDAAGAGYFMLMVQPREDERLKQSPPRELSFLIDVSGSMRGQPTAKVRAAMQHLLKLTRPQDTLQVITFAGNSQKLFERPVPCSETNIANALKVTEGLRGSGGTEMLKGVKMAINDPLDPKRVRIVIMLTDGYIGNEAEIIAEVGRRSGDHIRFWCIGIGQSVNRMLIDGVARQGGGMAKVLGLNEDALPLAQEIMYRIQRAQLADVTIDWDGLNVWETYPARIPELWAGRPIVLFGRYNPGAAPATVTVRGNVEGEPAAWPLDVHLPARDTRHDVLAKVWARQKIEELMHTTYYAGSPEVEEAVTQVALEYRLMSQYTSFVAVDESQLGRMLQPARPPRRMLVPVPIPEGTDYTGFFGSEYDDEVEKEAVLATGPVTSFSMPAKPGGAFTAPEMQRGNASYGYAAGGRAGGYGRMADGKRAGYARPSNRRGLAQFGKQMAAAKAPAGPPPLALMPSASTAPAADRLLRERGAWAMEPAAEGLDKDMASLAYGGYAPAVTKEGAAALVKAVEKALQDAEALQKAGDLPAARARFAHACLLDDACAAIRRPNGQATEKALAAIDDINTKLLEAWTKALPALDARLDLLIRNMAMHEACAAVGKAAGPKALPVQVVPGSVADAADLTRQRDVRVTYLDLRRATVAQALDWLCLPERLSWWPEGGTIRVGSARRSPVASPWVYDVRLIAGLSAKEIGEIKDHQKRIDAIRKDADVFLSAVRTHLGAPDDAVVWYGSGQILVFGDAKRHGRTAKLLADLADPAAAVPDEFAHLHKMTSARAGQRRHALQAMQAYREKVRTAASLAEYSWRLLADAAAGTLDLEALTYLQAAWKRPETADLLKVETADEKGGAVRTAAGIPLRSLWAIAEAAKALPKEKELASLAAEARRASAPAARAVADALEKNRDDDGLALAAIYAAMAMPDDSDLLAKVTPLVTEKPADAKPGDVHAVAAALLLPADKADAKALVRMVRQGAGGVRGADRVVLTALACRRAGGEAWRTFRAEARPMLGDQPLPGGVVVFVSRLSGTDGALASGK